MHAVLKDQVQQAGRGVPREQNVGAGLECNSLSYICTCLTAEPKSEITFVELWCYTQNTFQNTWPAHGQHWDGS